MSTLDSHATVLRHSKQNSVLVLPGAGAGGALTAAAGGAHQLRVNVNFRQYAAVHQSWHSQGAPQPVAAAADEAKLGQPCRS